MKHETKLYIFPDTQFEIESHTFMSDATKKETEVITLHIYKKGQDRHSDSVVDIALYQDTFAQLKNVLNNFEPKLKPKEGEEDGE